MKYIRLKVNSVLMFRTLEQIIEEIGLWQSDFSHNSAIHRGENFVRAEVQRLFGISLSRKELTHAYRSTSKNVLKVPLALFEILKTVIEIVKADSRLRQYALDLQPEEGKVACREILYPGIATLLLDYEAEHAEVTTLLNRLVGLSDGCP